MAGAGAAQAGVGLLPWLSTEAEEEALLQQASWRNEHAETIRSVFTGTADTKGRLHLPRFASLMADQGVARDQCAHIFRAMDRGCRSFLTFHDLLMGLCAMAESTPHAGDWLLYRSRYVFRMYDTKGDGLLDFDEFEPFVRDLRRSRGTELTPERCRTEALRLFSCLEGFSEDSFACLFSRDLGRLFRLPQPNSMFGRQRNEDDRDVDMAGEPSAASHRPNHIASGKAPRQTKPDDELPAALIFRDGSSSTSASAATTSGTSDASAAAAETSSDGKWTCAVCTYSNWAATKRCTMCGTDPVVPSGPPPAASNEAEKEAARLLDSKLKALLPAETLWLEACVAAADGHIDKLLLYLEGGGDASRSISVQDAEMLQHATDRKATFYPGTSLVDLALRFDHAEALAVLLPQSDVSPSKAKKQPAHVCTELAGQIRQQISSSLVQDKSWPCHYFAGIHAQTFVLPREIWALPTERKRRLMSQTLDLEAQDTLEAGEDPVINWSPSQQAASRLYAFWNGATGDCLIDAVCQAAWGVTVSPSLLLKTIRSALVSSLHECKGEFYPRWREFKLRELESFGVSLNEDQWAREWRDVIAHAGQEKCPLQEIHIFALAHMLRRPIVVYGINEFRNSSGEVLQKVSVQGIYLPLFWHASKCCKDPLAVCYTRGHFSALLSMEVPLAQVTRRSDLLIRAPQHVIELPLYTSSGMALPLHFLLDRELGRSDEILSRYIDVDGFDSGVVAARQVARDRTELTTRFLDQWLRDMG